MELEETERGTDRGGEWEGKREGEGEGREREKAIKNISIVCTFAGVISVPIKNIFRGIPISGTPSRKTAVFCFNKNLCFSKKN